MIRLFYLLQGKTQPQVVSAAAWRAVAAVRNTAVPDEVVPTAATIHAVRVPCGTNRISLCIAVVTTIPVVAPFPYITAHH